MNNLTRYWRRKKKAIIELLGAPHDVAVNPTTPSAKAKVQPWFDALAVDLVLPPSTYPWDAAPTARTLEDTLDEAITWLQKKNKAITDSVMGGVPNPERRSARLARMVQAAIKAPPYGRKFFASVADATLSGTSGFTEYREAVRVASACAARFLDTACVRTAAGADPGPIADALEKLAAANRKPVPTPPPHLPDNVLEEIDELVEAIRKAMARGGMGEGSSYWPSTWVSSSSSGG